MFTGIITHQGTIKNISFNNKKDILLTIKIEKKSITRKLKIGCSIACNGICLTLISQKIIENNIELSFQASQETANKTTINSWKINQKINIEFAMKLNDEFGGHMVLGHVDDTSKIINILPIKESWRFDFAIPLELKKFISPKGSITINGTSLTINHVENDFFSVNIISHTMKNTTFQFAKKDDLVNLEVDTIARYLYQLIQNNAK
jgi:riboflavin synthase